MADNDTLIETIPLNTLSITKNENFDRWLIIIQNIIEYLKGLDTAVNGDNGIQNLLDEATLRNQITKCVSLISSKKDCNLYVDNGVYYIKYVTTTETHLPINNDCIVYIATACGNSNTDVPIIQFAFNANTETVSETTQNSVFYVRKGKKRGNVATFSTESGFGWVEIATKNYVYNNYLNTFETNTTQTVKSNVIINNATVIKGKLTAKANAEFDGIIEIKELTNNNGVKLQNSDYDFTIETNKTSHVNNYPIYSEYGTINSEYQIPLEINYSTEICNINGTANYSNFVNPANMVREFKPEKITGYAVNYPVTGSALSSFYKYCEDTYMPFSGGNFTGIVNHSEDIFLRYINDINSHRTAALRSPDGQLNLQCQQITNLISTTKQCELYLEKEDVDSAEYTKNTASFSYELYSVEWNMPFIRDKNEEYVTSYDRNDDSITVHTTIGEIILEPDGRYSFIGTEETARNIDRNISYVITLYYGVMNRFGTSLDIPEEGNPTPIPLSNYCEHKILIDKSTGYRFNDIVGVNASHYQVVLTKSNFKNLPLVNASTMTKDSVIADGSYIVNNSIIDGYEYTNEKIETNEIFGTIITVDNQIEFSFTSDIEEPLVTENNKITFDDIEYTVSRYIKTVDGVEKNEYKLITLTSIQPVISNNNKVIINGIEYTISTVEASNNVISNGSKILNGSFIYYGSIINGHIQHYSSYLTTGDLTINSETILQKGSVIKSGSTINAGSKINGVEYLENTEIDGHKLTNGAVLYAGSNLTVGTFVAPNSILNSNSVHSGMYGIEIKQDSIIGAGSVLEKGTYVATNSLINNNVIEYPMYLTNNVTIISDTKLLAGSFIKAGSIIAGGSIINNISITVKYTVQANDFNGTLTLADVAPRMYIGTYNNLTDKHSNWIEYSYPKIYSNEAYNPVLWENRLSDIINRLDTQKYYKNEIIKDLQIILNPNNTEIRTVYTITGNIIHDNNDNTFEIEENEVILHGKTYTIDTRNHRVKNNDEIYQISTNNTFTIITVTDISTLPYQEIDDLYANMYNGNYTAIRTAEHNPQYVYDEFVYVSSSDRSISVDKIEFEICQENGPHDAYTIYTNGTDTINVNPTSDIFKYSNFNVRKLNYTYKITFDYILAKPLNQYDTNTQTFTEKIKFNFYNADSLVIPNRTQEERISTDAHHMMNSACVIGARTRTGITKEGEFGDPLYDLGCVEFGEDYTAIRLRKRNVTTLQNVKSDVAIILERTALKPEYTYYTVTNENEIEGHVEPSMISLGTADSKFSAAYLDTSPIETSDKNKKTAIKDIPITLLNAWKDVKWVTYKLKDSVEKKGKNARIHTGVIAQDLENSLSKIDLTKYGFFCKDTWEEEYSSQYVNVPKHIDEFGIERDEENKLIKIKTKEKGEQYSIRYQEMQAIENMYLRREIELLKEEIKALKEKIK